MSLLLELLMLSVCFEAGCVNSTSSPGEWLQLNFQAFSASARLRDFSDLNPTFDGVSELMFYGVNQIIFGVNQISLLLR